MTLSAPETNARVRADEESAAPRAFGCGWIEGHGRKRGYCAVASCKNKSPCTGVFADDLRGGKETP